MLPRLGFSSRRYPRACPEFDAVKPLRQAFNDQVHEISSVNFDYITRNRMKYMTIVFLIFQFSLDAIAQCEYYSNIVYEKNGECVGFDTQRQVYDIGYWNIDQDSLMWTSLFPRNITDPEIMVLVEEVSQQGTYRYSYSVTNGSVAEMSIFSFEVQAVLAHENVISPGNGWHVDMYSMLNWSFFLPPYQGIYPDSTVEGFSYTSSLLPGIVNSYVLNEGGLAGSDDGGPFGEIREVVDSLDFATRHILVETVGSLIDPATWNSIRILDTLITYPQRSSDLGWVTNTALSSDLETHLQAIRTALIASDDGAAAAELTALLALVEAEKDANLTSEAYAIFRYNAEYLLDQLENVSVQSLAAGWQLAGLPLDVPDSNYELVYNTVPLTQPPLAWGGTSYTFEEDMALERGYWINTDSVGTQIVLGTPVASSVLDLVAGWHLIAGPSCYVDVMAISDPGSILVAGSVFGYNAGYVAATTLDEGEGYWLQTSAAGQLTLDCAASAGKTALPAVIQDPTVAAAFRRIVVQGAGGSQTLYFGAAFPQPQAVSFVLPPPPPAGSFDARFEGDSRLVEAGEGVVRIQSGQYPVTVELGAGAGMILEELVDGDIVTTRPIAAGEPLPITNPAVTAFRLRLP